MMEMEKKLELLNTPIELRVLLNELRSMLNCFRAIEYQMALELDSIINETTGA